MNKFAVISKYKDNDINLPKRATKNSAGYDFEVAEDIILPPFIFSKAMDSLAFDSIQENTVFSLKEVADRTKYYDCRPTLVPTGIKCYLDDGYYLELSVRSSTPLKYLIIMANSVGIIDADYVDNPSNEGHIFFQLLNLSPYPIMLKKGDVIGQGIIKKYEITDDDSANNNRTGGFGSTTLN